MTYKRYRFILLCFLLVFAVSIVLRKSIMGSDLSALILLYPCALPYWLLLFFFLLHARKRITEDNKKIAPSKVLPVVVAWLVVISILYPITMIGIHKTANELVHRKIDPEDTLTRMKIAATDTSKTAEQRFKAAQFHYKYSGERIIYTDETARKKEYLPSDSAKQERPKYLEGLQQQRSLYLFMVVSGMLSLLSGLMVAAIYFRTCKKYRKENFA